MLRTAAAIVVPTATAVHDATEPWRLSCHGRNATRATHADIDTMKTIWLAGESARA
jgi:hypothetical protein